MAGSPIAVLYADGHLVRRAWTGRAIEGDSYYSMQQIVDYAIKHELPIVGAGDLLDRQRNDSDPIVFINRQLDRLKTAELSFLFIQGQHELQEEPWFTCHSLPIHVHSKSFRIGGVQFYGLDYQPAGQLQEELEKIPKTTDVLVAHQVWSDFMGDVAAPQGGFHDIPVASMVFTGDYHSAETLSVTGKDGQKLTAISPGATCMQAINEPHEHSFCVLDDKLGIRRIPLLTRPVIDIGTLHSQDAFEVFLDTLGATLEKTEASVFDLPEHIRTPILKVTYPYTLPEVRARVMKAVGDRAHVFLKELPPEKEESVARRKKRDRDGNKHATTLESKLPEFLEAKGLEHVQEPCLRLLQAEDIASELQRMRQEALSF